MTVRGTVMHQNLMRIILVVITNNSPAVVTFPKRQPNNSGSLVLNPISGS